MLSLSGPPGPWLRRDYKNSLGNPDPLIRSSTGEPGLSLSSTPQRFVCGPFPAVFRAPNCLRFAGRKAFTAGLNGLAAWSFRNPFGMTGGDPKHSRRTSRKLGQVRRARQGLVRVPLSNTKYGGKGGITGGDATPAMSPSISESSQIPKGKKLFEAREFPLLPLFTGKYLFALRGAVGIALWRLT